MNKLKKLFIIAYKNIFRKKKRGIMVGSTILISVVLLLVTNALASGIDKSIYKQQIYIDSGHILVKWDKDNDTSATDSKKKEIHDKLVTVIGDNKHVKNVFYNYVDTVHAHFSSSKIINCTLVAADYNAEKHLLKNAIKLVEGKFPEEGENSILLSKKYAEQNLLEVGSGIKLQYQNSNGETAEQMYRISGIFENSTPWHSSYIFVTYNTFNKMFGESKLSNNIKIMVDEESNIENVKGHLKEAIKRNTLPFVVSDYKEEATIYKGFSETARAMFNSMNFIVIFILFIGIQTIIILSLSDRKKEFVTLRVLGFYNKDITVLILFEYLIISLIALAIGILISLIVIGVIQQIGIPLKSDVLQYLFGNSYLYPVINSLDYIITVIMIFSFVIVSVLPQGLKKRKITSKSLN